MRPCGELKLATRSLLGGGGGGGGAVCHRGRLSLWGGWDSRGCLNDFGVGHDKCVFSEIGF